MIDQFGIIIFFKHCIRKWYIAVKYLDPLLSNYFGKKQVVRGTFGASWRIQNQVYPQTSFEPKYGAFYLKNKISAHGLVLLFRMSWRVAPPYSTWLYALRLYALKEYLSGCMCYHMSCIPRLFPFARARARAHAHKGPKSTTLAIFPSCIWRTNIHITCNFTIMLTVSLKEAFGQKDVPHHKNTAGSTQNFITWSMEVTALASSFHFP